MSDPTAQMSAADSAVWNAWAKQIVDRRLDAVMKNVGKVLAEKFKAQTAEMQAALDRRDLRIAALETRVAEYEARDPIRLPPLRAVS